MWNEVADRVDDDRRSRCGVSRDQNRLVIARCLRRAGRDDFVDPHCLVPRDTKEAVIAVGVGDGRPLARVERAVLVGVDEDGDTGDGAFANVFDAIAVGIFEFRARERDAVLEVPFLEGRRGRPVRPGRAHLGVQIEVGGGRIEARERRNGNEYGIVVGAAAGRAGVAHQDRNVLARIHVVSERGIRRIEKLGRAFQSPIGRGIDFELVERDLRVRVGIGFVQVDANLIILHARDSGDHQA